MLHTIKKSDGPVEGGAALRAALTVQFARFATLDGITATNVPWLRLYRSEKTLPPPPCDYAPMVALIVQGRKLVQVGDDQLTFDEGHFLLAAIDLPAVTYVPEASGEQPFMSLVAQLDFAPIRQMILDYDIPPPKLAPMARAVGTAPVTDELLGAFSRLLGLLDAPARPPVLADLLYREIAFHLLESEQGGRLWQLAMTGSQSDRIHKVVNWIRGHYAEPLRVEDLAHMAAMSVSSMRQHFHDLTAMSPMQFQRHLRLHEARRLMLVEGCDASVAALRVGYDSPSQFSREYARMFGQPPKRDVKQLRAASPALGA